MTSDQVYLVYLRCSEALKMAENAKRWKTCALSTACISYMIVNEVLGIFLLVIMAWENTAVY